MKIKINELTGTALDWLVAKCEDTLLDSTLYQYSTDWAWGGPIIEREEIAVGKGWEQWAAFNDADTEDGVLGPTPLVAAMRCYVGSVIGNEVEVPDELAEVAA